MKLKSVWASYEWYTEQLSANSRQLAFAAVAVCWIFRGEGFSLPQTVALALALVVAYFILDLAQYAAGAYLHYRLADREEERVFEKTGELPEDHEVEKPKSLDRWPRRAFIAKLVVLSASYALLLFICVTELFLS